MRTYRGLILGLAGALTILVGAQSVYAGGMHILSSHGPEATARGLAFTPQQLFERKTIGALAPVVVADSPPPPEAPLPSPSRAGFAADGFATAGLSPDELDDVFAAFGEDA